MTRDLTASQVEHARLKRYGLEPRDLIRIERALCTLGDYEGPVKTALSEIGLGASGYQDHAHVCAALRRLVGE
jgi:hypothetical protein